MKRFALLFTLLLAWSSATRADEYTRETLKDLPGVRILIETIDADLARAGLSEEQLQTDAARRLQEAGLQLLDRDAWLATPGGQYLYIAVDALPVVEADACAYAIRLELRQDAFLARAPEIKALGATTWRRNRIGFAPTTTAPDQILRSVGELIDAFTADYRTANTPTEKNE